MWCGVKHTLTVLYIALPQVTSMYWERDRSKVLQGVWSGHPLSAGWCQKVNPKVTWTGSSPELRLLRARDRAIPNSTLS